MYHWESCDIQGNFEQIASKWWVCIDCSRYGIEPDMLEGRCVTVKGQRKRLGKMADKTRRECAYFRPWDVGDYFPPERIKKRMSALYLVTDATEREREISELRIELKDCAAMLRVIRPYDATAPGIEGWQRWALEPLDDLLCRQVTMGWPLPPNQFSRAGNIDFYEVFNMFNDIRTRGRV